MEKKKSFGERVADSVGFDPTIIIAIVTAIINLLQQCKKPQNKAAAAAMIDEEVQALMRRRRSDRCPLQFRKVFRREGIHDKDDQDAIWEQMVAEANEDKEAVAAMLA